MNLKEQRLREARERRFHVPECYAKKDIEELDRVSAQRKKGVYYPPLQMRDARTVMDTDDYQKFMDGGKYLTMFELDDQTGPKWHHSVGESFASQGMEYHGDHVGGREFNDSRLFGNPCKTALVHAVLFTELVQNHDSVMEYIIRSYGSGPVYEAGNPVPTQKADRTVIHWDESWWKKHATFTFGDPQHGMFVWDYSEVALINHIFGFMGASSAIACLIDPLAFYYRSCIESVGSQGHQWHPYIELQIHDQATPKHVSRVEHIQAALPEAV